MAKESFLKNDIRRLRNKLGLTQQEFGRKLSKSQATISKYEVGEIAPTEQTMRRMEKEFSTELYFKIID